ncbi:MAG: sulfotransferase family protein [Actinomycetes bacterium]
MSSGQQPVEPAPERRLILVTSIGRSGTSLLTSILGQLGVRIPQPEVLADDTNPKGFGEPRWVVDLHAPLLRTARVTVWDSRPAAFSNAAAAAEGPDVLEQLKAWLSVQFVGTDTVVVKDPRIAWFLPLWERCAAELGIGVCYVSTLRHPAEAVRSAVTWYGTWQNDASRTAGWLNVTLHAEQATRPAPRVFVAYESLLTDWSTQIERVEEALGVPLLRDVPDATRAQVDAFVDPSLHRSKVSWADLAVPSHVERLAEQVWEHTRALAEPGGDSEHTRAELDEARSAYALMYAEAEQVAQSSIVAVKPRKKKQAVTPSAQESAATRGARPVIRANGKTPRRIPQLRAVARVLPPAVRRQARRVVTKARRTVRR